MIEKIDTSLYSLPSSRASQSGVGGQRSLMVANKINDIIDQLSSLATTEGLNQISDTLNRANAELTKRISALEFPISDAIQDVQSSPVNISVLNLVAVQAIGNQANANTTAINNILKVMRTRREIKT